MAAEDTSFTRDVLGRYVCNTFAEAEATDFRRFDIVIVGGGTFGAAIAEQLFGLDEPSKRHRILVLEGGPFLLPEHVQNLPPMHAGLGPPAASTIEELRSEWQSQNPSSPIPAYLPPRNEVWGLPWHSIAVPHASDPKDKRFPGLAYCIGGRSLSWGGWSPVWIDSELLSPPWPASVVSDLKTRYVAEAKRQLGTDVTNDFIFGPLHETLRGRLYVGAHAVVNVLPPNTESEVDAPLAVQSAPPRSGFFPFNKFSSMPLLMDAARQAEAENPGNDYSKRLMVVPNCHVTRLRVGPNGAVDRVFTNKGEFEVLPSSVVIVALGTIESTRLALLSFPNDQGLIGRNLMAHLRSNTTIRIPRSSFPGLPAELEASALFVKGKSGAGHFHLQITACGVRGDVRDSERELNKKIPDIDQLDRIRGALTGLNDDYVVATIRGIGEMVGNRSSASHSRVTLDPEADEFGVQRAIVTMGLVQEDLDLWSAMDTTAAGIAELLAAGASLEYLNESTGQWQTGPWTKRDGLGTTHHEAGTLWMGDDPQDSVTDEFGRIHDVSNAYVAGPALFPTVGSPNPMLGSTALLRRTARHLVREDRAPAVEPDLVALFDGSSTTGWSMAGSGQFLFDSVRGELTTDGGLGLFWFSDRTFSDFILRLDWRATSPYDNSGVFVRFTDPAGDPLSAVNSGYEVQIDDFGRPDGSALRLTGGIYSFAEPARIASRLPGEWNSYEITVVGQSYSVSLNGTKVVDRFMGTRSLNGYIGLQNHGGGSRVVYRNIRVKEL